MKAKETPSRAELVRQRRKQQDTRRVKRPAVRASVPAPTMPRRGATLDASTVRVRPTTKPVRRFETLAAAPPAATEQLQAPSLPRVHLGWRLVSFALALLFGAGIYLAWTLPQLRSNGAELAGNQILSAEEAESVLHLSGTPIFLIVPTQVETELRKHFPEILSANVSVKLPNRVIVTVTERTPVLRWEQNGVYAWIDAEGVVIMPRGEREGLITVRASGTPPAGQKSEKDALAPTPYVSAEIIEAIRLLAPHVPPGSVLLYDPKFGLGWVDGRGWTVWFGSKAAETDMRLRVYDALTASLNERGITPSFINVAYPSAPYYRLGK